MGTTHCTNKGAKGKRITYLNVPNFDELIHDSNTTDNKIINNDLLTINEIIDKYNISERTIYRKCYKHNIKPIKVLKNGYYLSHFNKKEIHNIFKDYVTDIKPTLINKYDISVTYNVSITTIERYTKKYNIKTLSIYSKKDKANLLYYTKSDAKKYFKKYLKTSKNNLLSINEIMDKYNICEHTVYRKCKKYNIKGVKQLINSRYLQHFNKKEIHKYFKD